ncbi:MAG TPA: o-succinylbenzoate synthase [Anaerolineales bacterium]|nr:o-succinylbenzoate synthase [Anaerolineales bacterium]
MKIESIILHHISMPLVAPFETSFGRETVRECIIVELRAEGLTGYGECVASREPGYNYETTGTAWHILKDFIAPLVLGQDLIDAADFQHRVERIRGHHLAKAGVEMALWDLLGKRDGRSLMEMFGGMHENVEVGVSIGIQESASALVKTVESYLSQGYRRVKIKIKPGREVDETTAVRKAYPDLRLQVDANSAYSVESARVLKAVDDLNLLLIEQPLFEDDIWDHRLLQAEFKTPMCLDESVISPRHARYALEMKACKIINIKPARLGGLSQGIAVHDYCLSQIAPVWCGGMLETGIGRASNLALASLPGFVLPADISASDRYYHRDITNERFVLNDESTITVPTAPGLGVTIDEAALKEFTLAETTLKAK